MIRKMLLLAVAVVLLTPMPAWDQQPAGNPELVAMLESMQEKCKWAIRTLKGAPWGIMAMHNAKMERILGQLRAGQVVDPKEIDEIVKEHSR
jgi:hypothetical protein